MNASIDLQVGNVLGSSDGVLVRYYDNTTHSSLLMGVCMWRNELHAMSFITILNV